MSVAPRTAAAMAAHWSARAGRFDAAASHNRHRDAWRGAFRAALGERPLRVVDLGCGTGACAVLLAGLGHRVTAADGSEGMLAQARAFAEAEGVEVAFLARDMDRLDLPEGLAEAVTLRNVLWTLEEPQAALRLARRLLAPGGRILIADGLWRRSPDPSMAEFSGRLPNSCGVTEAEARLWLETAGFRNLREWSGLFAEHPYGDLYDEPGSRIPFFLLTAEAP